MTPGVCQVCEHVYQEHVPAFLRAMGFPEEVCIGMDMTAHLNLATLRLDSTTSKLGAHRDPACPMPALIGGATTYVLGEGTTWQARARGGHLVLLDGLFDLAYGPRDLVLLDGNFMHTVTRLRALPTPPCTRPPQLERRSFILFNRWKRVSAGKGRHSPCWDESWRDAVPWLSDSE